MSGPKVGYITVEDLRRLQREQREGEAREREELEALRRQASRQESEEQRLRDLEAREQRRAERERQRAEARAEAARRERQPALEAYQRLTARIEAAMPQRGELQRAHEGLELPAPPAYEPDPGGDAEALHQATLRLDAEVLRYQRALDEAVRRWQRERAAGMAADEAKTRIAAARAKPARSADDVIAALESGRGGLSQRVADAAQLERLIHHAQARLRTAAEEHVPIRDVTLDALEAVCAATSVAAAQQALGRLETAIENDRQAAADARQRQARAEAQAEAQRREREAAEERQQEHDAVVHRITEVLQDLGYTVGEIQQTAVPGRAQLVALPDGERDHAVQVSFAPGGQVRMAPVRLVEENEPTAGQADRDREEAEDWEFDQRFCGGATGGLLGEVVTRSRNRGLGVRLRPEPGAGRPVGRLSVATLSPELRARLGPQGAKAPLQERTHGPGG